MREIGGLWVWADPSDHRLLIGNKVAAQEALCQKRDAGHPISGARNIHYKAPADVRCIGKYGFPAGPVLSLHIQHGLDHRQAVIAYSPMLQTGIADGTLTLGRIPASDQDHRTASDLALWKNGAIVARGTLRNGQSAPFSPSFEIARQLLSAHPVCAIVHGASVVWKGRHLVLAGVSGAGKSTLAAQLVADGGVYLGDDLVVILNDGTVLPMPMAPSIKEGSWTLLSDAFPALSDAPVFDKDGTRLKYLPDAPFCTRPIPIGTLIFPRFSTTDSAKAVRLEPVETLLNLSNVGMWAPPNQIDGLLDLLARVPAFALRHTPDLPETRALLREVCSEADTQ